MQRWLDPRRRPERAAAAAAADELDAQWAQCGHQRQFTVDAVYLISRKGVCILIKSLNH